jgi:hypothetical protein
MKNIGNITKSQNNRADQSRINGAKSHGPVTPEGKARSSQNSTKHGFTARRVVLDNESVEIYELILDRYSTLLTAKDIVEYDLVQTMVDARWRIRRAQSMESATYNTAILETKTALQEKFTNIDPATEQSFTMAGMGQKTGATVQYFHIQEDRFTRIFERSYKLLARHRGLKLSAMPPVEDLLAVEDDVPLNTPPIAQPEPKPAPTTTPSEEKLTKTSIEPNPFDTADCYFDPIRNATVFPGLRPPARPKNPKN